MPNYLSYLFNKDGREIERKASLIKDVNFYDANLNNIELNKIKDKVIVLDFWTTSCGYCFREFPEFEKLALEYTKSEKICFYAVNIIHKRDSIENVIKGAKKLGYKFPFLFTTQTDVEFIQKLFNVYLFPTVVILDKEGKIVYYGQLITKDIILYHNTKRTIDKLLKK